MWTGYPPDSFPHPNPPNALVAPFWSGLSRLPDSSVTGVYYYDDTASGKVYVQWTMFDTTVSYSEPVSFQASLEYGIEGSWITFTYRDLQGADMDRRAALIEQEGGLDALVYNHDNPANPVPVEGSSVLLYHPDLSGIGDAPLPEKLAISARPNPFNAAVTIEITGAEKDSRLEIYDIAGRRVRTMEVSGSRNLVWDGSTESGEKLPSGIYFSRLVSGEKTLKKRLILLR